jgi:hypothetical protein
MDTYGEYWEREKAAASERAKLVAERDTLAEALAAVLSLADEWMDNPKTERGTDRMITLKNAGMKLRAAVAAPLKAAGPDVAARLEAYGHLARLRAEVKAAQQTADPPTVAQAARQVSQLYGHHPGVSDAFSDFAGLLEGK